LEDYKEENNKKWSSFHLHHPLPPSALLLQLTLVLSHLISLQRVDMVYNSLLSLTPDLVQLVKQQLKLSLRNFTLSTLDEISTVVVYLLWHPKKGLGDEGLVTGTEMEMVLISRSVQFGLDCFIEVS